jgi:hypothetical protein
MRRQSIVPLEQGHLDGLCGVYSVVNATRLAAQRGERHLAWLRKAMRSGWEDALFCHLVRAAARVNRRADFVFCGLQTWELANLVEAASDWLITFFDLQVVTRRPFYRSRSTTVSKRCRTIAEHLDQPATAVIVGTDYPWNHWTVVARVEPNRLVLMDSGGQRYAPMRRRRGYADQHAGLIKPRSVFLLTIEAAG